MDNTDSFSVNNNFQHPKYRIKINQIQAKETKQENKQTHERVAADRAFETQAAIVRIMKSRKTITHAELVSEVISATRSRGPLDPAEIKKQIEKYASFLPCDSRLLITVLPQTDREGLHGARGGCTQYLQLSCLDVTYALLASAAV